MNFKKNIWKLVEFETLGWNVLTWILKQEWDNYIAVMSLWQDNYLLLDKDWNKYYRTINIKREWNEKKYLLVIWNTLDSDTFQKIKYEDELDDYVERLNKTRKNSRNYFYSFYIKDLFRL